MSNQVFDGVVNYVKDHAKYGRSIALKDVDGFIGEAGQFKLASVDKGDTIKVRVEGYGNKGNYKLTANPKIISKGAGDSESTGRNTGSSGNTGGNERWSGDWNTARARAIEFVQLLVASESIKLGAKTKAEERAVQLKEYVDDYTGQFHKETESVLMKKAAEVEEDLADEPEEAPDAAGDDWGDMEDPDEWDN